MSDRDKRPEFPNCVMTREIIQRIRSDQEYWDRTHLQEREDRK